MTQQQQIFKLNRYQYLNKVVVCNAMKRNQFFINIYFLFSTYHSRDVLNSSIRCEMGKHMLSLKLFRYLPLFSLKLLKVLSKILDMRGF